MNDSVSSLESQPSEVSKRSNNTALSSNAIPCPSYKETKYLRVHIKALSTLPKKHTACKQKPRHLSSDNSSHSEWFASFTDKIQTPHRCTVCFRSFKGQDSLIKHKAIHSIKKNYGFHQSSFQSKGTLKTSTRRPEKVHWDKRTETPVWISTCCRSKSCLGCETPKTKKRVLTLNMRRKIIKSSMVESFTAQSFLDGSNCG